MGSAGEAPRAEEGGGKVDKEPDKAEEGGSTGKKALDSAEEPASAEAEASTAKLLKEAASALQAIQTSCYYTERRSDLITCALQDLQRHSRNHQRAIIDATDEESRQKAKRKQKRWRREIAWQLWRYSCLQAAVMYICG